jgi:hypothetical protein
MTQQDILKASPLDKYEVRRAITALRRTAIIQLVAPTNSRFGAPGRYELTGKTPSQRGPVMPSVPLSSARFDALLAAWGIAAPKRASAVCPSRVIRSEDQDHRRDPDIPKFAPRRRRATGARRAEISFQEQHPAGFCRDKEVGAIEEREGCCG